MGNTKVLFVDDEAGALNLYAAMLKDEDFDIHFYTDPKEAIEFIEDEVYALILLDINMPGINGFEFAEKIRRSTQNNNTPFLFLTAYYHSSEIIQSGYDLGAVDFLFKPVDRKLLISKINVFVKLFEQKRELIDKTSRLQNELNEHKATRKLLQHKEYELEMAQDIARMGSWKWDLIQDKFHWSENLFKLHHVDNALSDEPEKMEYVEKFVHEQDKEKILDFYEIAGDSAEKYRKFDYRIITPAGEVKYLQAISRQINRNGNKRPDMLMGTVQDITEEKCIENELQKKTEQLSLAIEASNLVVYEYDFDTGHIHFSDEIKKIFDETDKTTFQFPEIARYFDKDDWQKLKFTFENCILGAKQSCDAEFSLNLSAQRKYFVNRGMVFKDNQFRSKKILGAFIDITHLRDTQNQLKQLNSELERRIQSEVRKREKQQQIVYQKSKLESLGELAAGIGHEVSHPLSIINLSVDNALSNLNNGVDYNYIKKKLNGIQLNVDKISHIIKQIRVFSRDQKPEDRHLVDINEVVKNVLSLIITQYKNHNIFINTDLDNNLSHILGNASKIEQIIFNFLSNAKHALEEKDKLNGNEGYQKKIQIVTFEKNNYIYLTFWDNGCGIDQSIQDKIFEPFYTTKASEVGTGLGLSVVFGIINELQGSVTVNSEPGLSTQFVVALPKDGERVEGDKGE